MLAQDAECALVCLPDQPLYCLVDPPGCLIAVFPALPGRIGTSSERVIPRSAEIHRTKLDVHANLGDHGTGNAGDFLLPVLIDPKSSALTRPGSAAQRQQVGSGDQRQRINLEPGACALRRSR
jgi:hypothetical protein